MSNERLLATHKYIDIVYLFASVSPSHLTLLLLCVCTIRTTNLARRKYFVLNSSRSSLHTNVKTPVPFICVNVRQCV